MAAPREDRFANVVSSAVTMSAANVITFNEMLTGISLGQGVGMLIDQIDYQMAASSAREIVAASDDATIAITTSNDLTDLNNYEDRRIIHSNQFVAVAVTVAPIQFPKVAQFFPPLIIAAPRIYLAMDTAGFGAAGIARLRIYFRYIALTPQQYIELAEAFVLVG